MRILVITLWMLLQRCKTVSYFCSQFLRERTEFDCIDELGFLHNRTHHRTLKAKFSELVVGWPMLSWERPNVRFSLRFPSASLKGYMYVRWNMDMRIGTMVGAHVYATYACSVRTTKTLFIMHARVVRVN